MYVWAKQDSEEMEKADEGLDGQETRIYPCFNFSSSISYAGLIPWLDISLRMW